ncbi:THAP domain-containing protein 3-like [Aricia agestis]|uniref:THAP domain-containing protein 3-like n=1 Tax=Aricia agestis TaxID=91739 RepID=UPI001C202041|nr:THAP domain-containing protein 3-like [Aricia agestis]
MRTCVYCKTRYEKGSAVTFHKFPSDHTLKLWLENMNIVNWIPKSHDCLCSKHFTDDCFIKHQSRTTLNKFSIPTIFLETDSSLVTAQSEMSSSMQVELPNFDFTHHTKTAETDSSLVTAQSEMLSSMEVELPNFDLTHIPSTAETDSSLVTAQSEMSSPVPSTSYTTSHCRTPKKSRTHAEICASIKLDHRYESTPKSSKKELQRVKKALKMSQARVKVLSQNVKLLKLRVSSLRIVIADLKKKKQACDDCVYVLNQYDDFKPQLFQRMSKNVKRAKYAPELRSFAITLHFYSPKAYSYVRKKFDLALPHPRVIRSWYSSIDANPGFSVESFNALRYKSEFAKQKGKKLIDYNH